jgi:Protein of unknown function (DUF3134)
MLDWLESSGRLLARQPGDLDFVDDEEEINELMAGDNSFDDAADDDDEDLGDLDD